MLVKVLIFLLVLATGLSLEDDKYDSEIGKARGPKHPIHPLLADRSSQREFTGEEISSHDLNSIFEAVRWAPSAMNVQPWRFVYAKRNTPRFNEFAGLLLEGNQIWANKSSILIAQIAPNYEMYKDKVSPLEYNTFDSGSAYMSLALEASGRGFSAVALGGVDFERAYVALNVTRKTHTIPIFIALGKNPDDEHRVSNKTIQPRKDLNQIVFQDFFVNNDPTGDVKY